MNLKRQVIECFIAEDLPKAITDELAQGALAEGAQAAKDLEAARKKVLDALGEEALDAEAIWQSVPQHAKAGKEYLAAQEKANPLKVTRRWKPPSTITSTLFLAATVRTATLSPNAATPKKNATPSPTTARRSISTGPTTTSIMSRPASILLITPGKLPAA